MKYGIAVVLVIAVTIGIYIHKKIEPFEVTYVQFTKMLEDGKISEVSLNSGPTMKFKIKGKDVTYRTDNPRVEDLKETLLLHDVHVDETAETVSVLQYILGVTVNKQFYVRVMIE